MYLPAHFAEPTVATMHQLIEAHPLGLLVTLNDDGLNGNHVPFEIDPNPAPHGTLRAHVARANPVWREADRQSIEPLVVFHGPRYYVTPSWYPSKAATGQVVPTYNYVVVHAYGRLRAIEDRDWLAGLVDRLTRRHEASLPTPWQVTDAPPDYIDKMLAAIVGLELTITRLVGKWKLSQNRSATDRAGVVQGLAAAADDDAREMARWMTRR